MKDAVLHIDNLTNGLRSAQGHHLILQEGLEMQLRPGQFVCLLGPNGAGKSTLLRILMGFQPAISGEIRYNDRKLDDLSLKELAKIAAVVLTDRFSDPYLIAREVVSLGRYPYGSFAGRLHAEDKEVISQTIATLGIETLMDKVFRQLSDGEKQKVLIARALVQDTPFVFLDEPVAFVDSPSRIEIMEMLADIAHQRNKGILMTTHDIEIAIDYADYLWLMKRGTPVETGIPEDLALQGKINTYFDKESIQFDRQTARFCSLNAQSIGKLFVKQDSLESFWLSKALRRKGFEVIEGDDIPEFGQSIYFDGEHFVLASDSNPPKQFTNIPSVLENLPNFKDLEY